MLKYEIREKHRFDKKREKSTIKMNSVLWGDV
jgi:hypothetical protein